MKVSEAFPSKYMAAADLDGNNLRLVMKSVEIEKLGDDTKPVLYFRGQTKGLALNKTNSKTIADAYGDEMDDWTGNEIILFPVMTDYQGKSVEAIRVRAPQPKDNPRPAARQSSADMGREAPKRQTGGVSESVPEYSDDDFRS
jgi:hypothetical protein